MKIVLKSFIVVMSGRPANWKYSYDRMNLNKKDFLQVIYISQ